MARRAPPSFVLRARCMGGSTYWPSSCACWGVSTGGSAVMSAAALAWAAARRAASRLSRSEEHTSELQSQSNLVCRLLLEKKKQTIDTSAKADRALPERHLRGECA